MEEIKEEEFSDDEKDLYITEVSQCKSNMRDCGIQTSTIHFKNISKSTQFQNDQFDKDFSTDWSLSSIYDDLQF